MRNVNKTIIHITEPYLLKPSQKDPKPAKRPKKIAKQPETTQNFKTGEIRIFLQASVFQTSSPNAQIWVFWAKKYQLSNLSTKFYLYTISNILISILTLVFKSFEPKSPNMGILGQKVSTF